MTGPTYGNGTDVPILTLRDGYFRITDTAATSDSNPGNTATVEKNALYAKNIPKGWVKAYGTTGIDEAFGLSSLSASGYGTKVTWQHSTPSSYDSAYAGIADGTGATSALYMTVDNHAVNACTVRLWRWNGSAIIPENIIGEDWSLIRHARTY